MRLAKRSMTFNRFYNRKYSFNYITILINLFNRKGFKLFTYKIIFNFLYLIKLKYKMSVNILLETIFTKYLPIISFISKKIATNEYNLPWLLNIIRAKIIVIKWFIQSSLTRFEPSLILKLYYEFNDIFLGYGKTIKLFENYYLMALKNRPFMRFLRKRRKVFLSRLKKYGIK